MQSSSWPDAIRGGSALRKALVIRGHPADGKRRHFDLMNQSPDRATEPGAKRRSCQSTVLLGQGDQRDRFGHLIAQYLLGESLRVGDGSGEVGDVSRR